MDKKMKFKYFYGTEADQFSFYRIPKALFTDSYFKDLSSDAKILYGLMLDRMSLSIKNQWFDEKNRAYIYFSIEDIMELLNCGRNKAIKSMQELDDETGIGLIEKRRQGFGKVNIIYVKTFMLEKTEEKSLEDELKKFKKQTSEENEESTEVYNSNFMKSQNQTSRSPENKLQEVYISNPNYTNLSDTEMNYNKSNQIVSADENRSDGDNPTEEYQAYSDDDNPLGVKSDFVLSLCELIMGSRDGIEAEEKSVVDRCLPLVYQKYFADPKPENMPVLGDLYDCLRKQKEPQAQRIATALEIYVNGSLKVFNHRTNVELNNRIVCFDIKELGKQLKKIGMLIVQDQVWNRVTINRGIKSTRYYIDEFHLLLKEEQTAAYSVEIWKRFRKWGGIPSGITQNIKDLLASREIENIFENSDFILMLNQAAGDRQILAKQLNISPYQLSYVTNSGEGEGLLFYGTTIIPFKDKFDKTLKLYSLMTTKPEEVEKREKEMEAEKHEGNR